MYPTITKKQARISALKGPCERFWMNHRLNFLENLMQRVRVAELSRRNSTLRTVLISVEAA
jgi:hypothetical protein